MEGPAFWFAPPNSLPVTGAMPITALLLAGRRPGIDPLAAHAGVADKVLIPVGGVPMLSRTARALLDHPRIAQLVILSQEGEALARHGGTEWLASDPRVVFERGGSSVSEAVAGAIGKREGFPFLVATADDALLDAAKLDAFIADAEGADLAVALVERRTLLASYPGSRRTWLKFRGGAYSGANLFWLGSVKVLPVIGIWRRIEQERKKGRAVVGAFGPLILAAVALRILSLKQAIARVGRRFGLTARPVVLDIAEACIDVDKPDDLALAEQILAGRG